MKKRSKFHAHGDNPLKKYRRKFSDFQVRVRAEIARQARLRDRSMAELAFEEILKELEIEYEKEKIFQNGDRWVLVDFFIPEGNLAIEIDGLQHTLQADYDRGRTEWLAGKGIKTIRFQNPEVVRTPEYARQKLLEIVFGTSTETSDSKPADDVVV